MCRIVLIVIIRPFVWVNIIRLLCCHVTMYKDDKSNAYNIIVTFTWPPPTPQTRTAAGVYVAPRAIRFRARDRNTRLWVRGCRHLSANGHESGCQFLLIFPSRNRIDRRVLRQYCIIPIPCDRRQFWLWSDNIFAIFYTLPALDPISCGRTDGRMFARDESTTTSVPRRACCTAMADGKTDYTETIAAENRRFPLRSRDKRFLFLVHDFNDAIA